MNKKYIFFGITFFECFSLVGMDTDVNREKEVPSLLSLCVQSIARKPDARPDIEIVKTVEPVLSDAITCQHAEGWGAGAGATENICRYPSSIEKSKYQKDHFYVNDSCEGISIIDSLGEQKGFLLEHYDYCTYIGCSFIQSYDKELIFSLKNQMVNLWTTSTNKRMSTCAVLENSCQCMTEDGRYLYMGFQNNALQIWDLLSGKYFLPGRMKKTSTLKKFMASYGALLTGYDDGVMGMEDLSFVGSAHEFKAHENSIRCIVRSKYNDYCFFSADEKCIKIWDIRKLYVPVNELKDDNGSIRGVYEFNKGKNIFSFADDGIKVWATDRAFPFSSGSYPSNIVLNSSSSGYNNAVHSIEMNDDESRIYAVTDFGMKIIKLKKHNLDIETAIAPSLPSEAVTITSNFEIENPKSKKWNKWKKILKSKK